jgi:hypothetical protein
MSPLTILLLCTDLVAIAVCGQLAIHYWKSPRERGYALFLVVLFSMLLVFFAVPVGA